ncbi:hypothetical protein [Candidatus Ichthyocystis sparus]|uniref:hypothetical protein n=1 Tax=Candidatus Ichthyocystis sparus TaxID=1561004 RepID=UPI0011472B51|nr:hypothetical protein [Candidatus Ichthyocystis sparus]
MNPITGLGGASSGIGGDDDADQADGSGLQQVQFSLGDGLVAATVSTTATTSSAVTTAAATTSAGATTYVGKGSSGSRSKKGKGPAPKSCATGVVVPATAVHFAATATATATATAGANFLELTDLTFYQTISQTMRCCGFLVCTPDLLALRAMESNFLCTVEEVAGSIFRSRIGESTLFHGNFGVREISDLRDGSFAAVELHMSDFTEMYLADVYRRVLSSSHLVDGEIIVFSSEEACRFRGLFFADTVTKIEELLAFTWNSDISRTLGSVLGAPASDCTRRATTCAHAAIVAPATVTDHTRAAAITTSPNPITAPASDCTRRVNIRTRAAAPASIDDPTTTTTTVTTVSSTPSLLPDPSSLDPGFVGFVDLFGFGVLPELSEVVNRLISEVCAFAKRIYPHMVRAPVTDVLCKLSGSEQFAWCIDNMMFYETNLVARCFAAYYAKFLPEFIDPLCSVRAWDFSSRSLLPLMGNRLGDFWVSLDQAVLRAVGNFFTARWDSLIRHLSVPLGPGEGSSALCGGDFVNAYDKVGVPSLSVSRFGLITGGTRAQVVPHGGGSVADGHSVDLFGFKVPPEVSEMFNILICGVSALARRTYSSLVRVPMLDALSVLSSSEQHAWLVANVMLYKTAFMAKCFAEYCAEFRPVFIDSLFGVRAWDTPGSSFLSLTGERLRSFWMLLGRAIMEVVGDIFAAEWGKFTRPFFASLGPGEESSFTVLCGRDFVNARAKAGVPALAISGAGSIMRARRARKVSHVAEEASGSSVASSSSVSASSITTAVVEIEESSTITRRNPLSGLGPKKSFMSRFSSGTSSSGVSSSSVLSSSIVSAVPLSSVSVGMSSISTLATTTDTGSGEGGDIGERLAALLNRDLPPSPPPASESTPAGGGASSSHRGGGKRKRKRKS